MSIARARIVSLTVVAIVFALVAAASATDKQAILFSFSGKAAGNTPMGGLVADAAGNLYGTTSYGGANISQCLWSTKGCGTVFELSPGSSGAWTETILYNFTGGSDGGIPIGSLIFDAKGNLYGTTARGGNTSSSGTVFELSPSSSGGWTETTLHIFTGAPDGQGPVAGLAMDAKGNLYGTTLYGGVDDCNTLPCGTVFEVSPSSDGTWTETVLHAFTGPDGYWPQSNLTFDTVGNLYGTTTRGGADDNGEVFSLSPSSRGWTLNIVHSFGNSGGDGRGPQSGVIFDFEGNLYGTTLGGNDNNGTVFELTPTGSFPWTETVLYEFANGSDSAWPSSSLTLDRWGNLYGTTIIYLNPAIAFKISSASTGRVFTVLHVLPGASVAPLIRDAAGNLYGTTENGGVRSDSGTVFELSSVK